MWRKNEMYKLDRNCNITALFPKIISKS